MQTENTYSIKIDRDSVCAGDDSDPHDTIFTISASATIADLLALVNERHYLASISGGKATWLVEAPGFRREPIGVVAQQWDRPKLLFSPETLLTTLFSDGEPRLFFRYWEQSDPDLVFSSMQTGQALPNRYAR